MFRSCESVLSSIYSSHTNALLKRGITAKLVSQVRALCSSKVLTMTGVKEELMPKDVILATVKETCDLSPTVKGLKLLLSNSNFSFHAGQWVDFFIPNAKVCAGFSICSTPRTLLETGQIELAVKISSYPPVEWVHSECCPGSQVGIKVGGDFYYNEQSADPTRDVLLIAGGVGINPLISIMRQFADISAENQSAGRLVLLFSARSAEELIFQNDIGTILLTRRNTSAEFFITRQSSAFGPKRLSGINIRYQRIDDQILSSLLQSSFSSLSNVDCYLCGPNAMIDAVDKYLLDIGLSQKQIRYEKWW